MTYQTSCSDPGFYSGSTINLSPYNHEYLWILKSALKSAGSFYVRGSGDGNAIYSNSADILTNNNAYSPSPGTYVSNSGGGSDPKIANSCSNNLAFFIISPDALSPSVGEFCIQLLSFADGSHQWRVKFSSGGFAAVTSATQVPGPITAGDEIVLIGAGTDASPSAGTASGLYSLNYRFNVVVDDDVTTPRFWAGGWAAGAATNMTCGFLWDHIVNRHTGDDYTNGFYACADSSAFRQASMGDGGASLADAPTSPYGVKSKRTGESTRPYAWTAMCSTGYLVGGAGRYNSQTLGKDSYIDGEPLVPMFYCRPGEGAMPTGKKGYSSIARYQATPHTIGDHGDDLPSLGLPYEWVAMGEIWLPWNSSTECIY